MKGSIVWRVFGTILVLYMMFIAPVFYASITQYNKANTAVLLEARNLVDAVIDSRVLTKNMIADFNLALASQPINYTSTITRKVAVINPDPVNPGKTYLTYVPSNDISKYNQGDIITVKVEQVGQSLAQVMSIAFRGVIMKNEVIILPARVR